MTSIINDAEAAAFFNLGASAPAQEQQARQLITEAEQIQTKNIVPLQSHVKTEERTEAYIAKAFTNHRKEMAELRRGASMISESATMRAQTRATFERQMKDEVIAVVSPPTSPRPSNGNNDGNNGNVDGGSSDDDNNSDGRTNDNDQEDVGSDIITTSGGTKIHPAKFIAMRRQEMDKRKASIFTGAQQIDAKNVSSRSDDAQAANIVARCAADDLSGKKAEQERAVEAQRRELEAAKRREKSLAEAAQNSRTRYGENGMTLAEKSKYLMVLKKENQDVEAELNNDLAALEDDITKATTTEISTLEARIASLSVQLDHIRGQNNDVKQLRAEAQAAGEETDRVISEMKGEKETNATISNERDQAIAKLESTKARLAEIEKNEIETDQLQAAADREESEKKEAVEAEKEHLLKEKEAATALLVNLQQGSSQDDDTNLLLDEKIAARKAVEAKMEEKRNEIQTIEAELVGIKDEAAKDEEGTKKQISSFQQMKAATEQNIQGMRERIEQKKAKRRSEVKKAIESIRQKLGRRRAEFDLHLNVLKCGGDMIDDSQARTKAIQERPIPGEDEPVLSPEVPLSTEAVNAPSPSQQSQRHGRSGGASGGRRRRGAGVGSSRRRRTT